MLRHHTRFHQRTQQLSPESQKNSQFSNNHSSTTKEDINPLEKVRALSQKKLTITTNHSNPLKKYQTGQSDIQKFYKTSVRPNLTLQNKKSVIQDSVVKVSLKKLQNNDLYEKSRLFQKEERQLRQTERKQLEEVIKRNFNNLKKEIQSQQTYILKLQKRMKEMDANLMKKNEEIQLLKLKIVQKDKYFTNVERKHNQCLALFKQSQMQQEQLNKNLEKVNQFCTQIMDRKLKFLKEKLNNFVDKATIQYSLIFKTVEKVHQKLPIIFRNFKNIEGELQKLEQPTKQSINENWQMFQDFDRDEEESSFNEDYFFYPKSQAFISSSRFKSQRKKDRISDLINFLEENYRLPLPCIVDKKNRIILCENNNYLLDNQGHSFSISEEEQKFLVRQKYIKMKHL